MPRRDRAFIAILGLAFLAGQPRTASAQKLRITSPASGSVAYSGQTLLLTVDADPSTFRSVGILTDGRIGAVADLTAPPYRFSLPIPANVPSGHYSLGAIGMPRSGGDPVFIDVPLDLDVERPDSPRELRPVAGSLNFRYVGEDLPLEVIGLFTDGARVRLTESTYTSYSSNSPNVATVDISGTVTAVAPGVAQITVTYRGGASVVTAAPVPAYVPDPVEVNPSTMSMQAGQSEKFEATLSIDPALDQSVTWSIDPAVGTIDATGVYTAPASVATRQKVKIIANTVTTPTKTGAAEVWLLPRPAKP